ncbi:hypothetical protein QJQ45_003421 [Haematococcus lacustris]|nr:hypothetical protein QJQ45_003421 [Haematococcus lacustris]
MARKKRRTGVGGPRAVPEDPDFDIVDRDEAAQPDLTEAQRKRKASGEARAARSRDNTFHARKAKLAHLTDHLPQELWEQPFAAIGHPARHSRELPGDRDLLAALNIRRCAVRIRYTATPLHLVHWVNMSCHLHLFRTSPQAAPLSVPRKDACHCHPGAWQYQLIPTNIGEPTQPTKGKGKAQGKAAKAKPAPQAGRWVDRDCNAAQNMQRIGESRWRPLELCFWPDQGALPAKGEEYPGLGYKRLRDKPHTAQQQQPAVAQ